MLISVHVIFLPTNTRKSFHYSNFRYKRQPFVRVYHLLQCKVGWVSKNSHFAFVWYLDTPKAGFVEVVFVGFLGSGFAMDYKSAADLLY